MRTILITIDAGETHCDGCEHLHELDHPTRDGMFCDLFAVIDDSMEVCNMPRPAECLEAEKRAKEQVLEILLDELRGLDEAKKT